MQRYRTLGLIQLPSTVPTGSVAIQASAGGAMSPSGTTIFVSAQ